ncbi:MAG: helix-hairpin-helix domain-containing protein [Candidatus Sericytochromatia bacterium]
MNYLRWICLTTFLTLLFTTAGVWIEARLKGDAVASSTREAVTVGPGDALAATSDSSTTQNTTQNTTQSGSQIIQATYQLLITGAVHNPGIYRLPAGSKVRDLVAAAGGAEATARLSSLNLERTLKPGEVVNLPAAQPLQASAASPAHPGKPTRQISLNRAGLAELDGLPGVGPALAKRILEYRQAHGAFKSLEELLQVKGIGAKKFEKLQGLLSI